MKSFVDASAVATICGFADRAAFLRARNRLEEDEGFPLPMPSLRRPLLWRADQVHAWVDRVGLPRAAVDPVEVDRITLPPNVVLMAEARRA